MRIAKDAVTRLLVAGAILFAMAVQVATAKAQVPASTGDKDVTAIDILLEPDATMLSHAEANNARLLKVFPNGFALDATHRPHITLIQRFVRNVDLDKVYGAVDEVFARDNVTAMRL